MWKEFNKYLWNEYIELHGMFNNRQNNLTLCKWPKKYADSTNRKKGGKGSSELTTEIGVFVRNQDFGNKNQEHIRVMDKRHKLKGNSARNIKGF